MRLTGEFVGTVRARCRRCLASRANRSTSAICAVVADMICTRKELTCQRARGFGDEMITFR